MTTHSIQPPFPTFSEADGSPLEAGYIWIGTANLNPITNPISVYWDVDLTQAAAQPIRTQGGYPVNSGTPARLYVNSNFSIQVQNSKGSVVYNAPDGAADRFSAAQISFIQAGTGAVTRTAQAKMRDVVSVADFGVLSTSAGDASANTAIIQAALDACELSGAVLIGVPGTFPINSTLVIECSCDLSMMNLTIAAGASTVGIRVGPNVAGQYLFDADIALPFIINSAKSGAGWAGFTNSIGVEVANVYQSRITVPSIYNFGVGLSCGGYGVGCVYNTFTLGVLFGNRINVQLLPKTTTGWCNQNTFIGGRLGYNTAEGTSVAGVIQIQLRHQAGATNGAPNNNVFLNPSIEGNEPQFHLDIQGAYNQWIAPRFEVGTGVPGRVNFYAETAGETSDNNLIGGYDVAGITYTFAGAGTSPRNKRIGGGGSDSYEYSSNGINLNNKSGNSRVAPHLQGFPSSQTAITKTNASTDWIYRLHGDGLSIKASADSFDRVAIDSNGFVNLSRGGATPTNYIRAGAPAGEGLIAGGGHFYPDTDNTRSLGRASERWSVVYAGTGTINTSDERAKQDIAEMDAAEKRVAVALKGLVKKFRFKDAVRAKGDGARIHVGVIAQEVVTAFEAESLDPMRYAIVCYDEWDALPEELDESGNVVTPARPAGNRYGVRYEQLLAFIIAAL